MASPFRTKNQFLTAKAETTPGVDAAPDLTNAILCEAPGVDPAAQTERNPEVTGGLDSNPAFFNGGWRNGTARVHMKGSGTPATPPDWATLLRGCAFAVTNMSSALTGTAQATTANTITLASGASSVDNAYKGMPIIAGTQKARIIVAYNGTTKVATISPAWAVSFGDGTTETTPSSTVSYSIPAGSLLYPVSSGYPWITWKRYFQSQLAGNSTLDPMFGWQGNPRFAIARAGCTIDFDGRGQLQDDQDVSWPGQPTFLNAAYPPMIGGQVFFNDVAVPMVINLDMGNQVTAESDPNAPNGYGIAAITGRETTGSLQLPRRLKATFDAMAAIRTGAANIATAVWGSVAGNRLAFSIPALAVNGRGTADVDGVVHDNLTIGCYGANGNPFIYCY